MVAKITPADQAREPGQTPGMERAIAVSGSTVGSTGLYASVVTTPPGGATRVHHHGPCETSIYIVRGRAHFTWGPTGVEHEVTADPGDFVYIPAGEVHVEKNALADAPLEVVVTRNCAEAIVVYVD